MKRMMQLVSLGWLGMAGLLNGCFIESDDSNEDAYQSPYSSQDSTYSRDTWKSSQDDLSKATDALRKSMADENLRNEERQKMCRNRYQNLPDINYPFGDIKKSCSGVTCGNLPIVVTYLQEKDIGDNMWAVVEAYDNPYFLGAPKGYDVIQNFHAEDLGYRRGTVLTLPTGFYYLRTYLVEPNQVTLPENIKGKVPANLQPPSTFSAISSVQKVTVEWNGQNPCMDAVNLNLDQLYVDPQAQPRTDAKFRMQIKLGDGLTVERKMKLKIELFHDKEFDVIPAYSYTLPSESLLIQGALGQTEFMTPNLETGFYYVRIFYDANQNDAFDPGELVGFAKEADVIVPLKLEEKHTIVVPLVLANK